MRCPRCNGFVVSDRDETSCLNCGWVHVDREPAEYAKERRQAPRLRGRTRETPKGQGFGSGRPGYCVNGHGFRAADHQRCIHGAKVAV